MEERDRDLEQSEQKALLVLFFFSGVSSLVYQVVWARMLTVVFGTTLLATSTVLSAFMAGLALGSYVLGRYIDRCKHPLRIFAALEVGIGLFALFFPSISANLGNAYGALVGLQGNFYLFSLARFGLCFALLLIPTALMGGTLPVMAKFAVRRLGRLGGRVGQLYAVNTLGAVIGVLAATFGLMEGLGLQGTTQAIAVVNFLVAGAAWLWGGQRAVGVDEGAATKETAHSDLILWGVLACFAISGFAALGYEVAWMRLLMVSFSFNSHYEFSIVLVAFLSGLSLGGWLGSRLLVRRADLLSIFIGIQFLIGACGALSVLAFAHLSVLVEPIQRADSWWVSRTGVFFTAVAIMLLPTVAMGVIFPLVGQIYTRQLARLGRGIGDIGAVNSLGAVGGAFVTGFVLIPLLGTEWSVKVLAALNGLVGLTLALVSQQRKRLVWSGAAGLALLLVLVPSDVLRRIAEPAAVNRELVFYQEGAEGVITVEQQTDGFRKMALNGGGQVPTDYSSLQIFRLLGHLPLLLHPDPQEVLVVSLGGGIALGGAAQYEPRRITCVELVPEVIDAARLHFGEFNHHVLENPTAWNIELVIDDGRNFLLSSRDTYQIITGDATHPTSADSWVLYTKEFYELCRAHLSTDGIMAQWLPFHGLPPDDYKTIVRTFQHVFPHATLWRSNNYSIMVGTMQPQAINWELLNEKMAPPRVHRSLEDIDMGNVFALLNTLVMDEVALRRYVGEGTLNTDDHPYISFVSPKGYSSGSWEVLEDLAPHRTSALSLLTAPSAAVRRTIEAYFKAGEHALEGDIMRLQNRDRAAVRAYQRALQANPEDRSSAYFLDLLAEQLIRRPPQDE
ncbi:MAG: fused MFS/spermidine synthase [Gemmatimonadetes bacterium]|nr:fused MFS/spermidine synthase [Gemmatimonadota bacterium]